MAVTLTLAKAGATDYTVRNYEGDIVATGSVAGSVVTIPAPAGGWLNGWYRVYFTGPVKGDAVYGDSYGVTNFVVVPSNANFPTIPASTGTAHYGGNVPSGNADTDTEAISGVGVHNFDSPVEMITRACLGLNTGRLTNSSTSNPNGGTGQFDGNYANAAMAPFVRDWWINSTEGGVADPVRARKQWIEFPNWSHDEITVHPTESSISFGSWLHILPINPGASQSNIWVNVEAGSSSGYKITVRYPDSATIVETYDNVASDTAAQTALLASGYVRGFPDQGGTPTLGLYQMPTTYRDGIISVVSTLYPLGVTHFEGPYNEPDFTTRFGALGPLQMKHFQEAVHAGNAAAKAIGPCTATISQLDGALGDHAIWKTFLDGGGGSYLDEISFHAYNTFVANGDVNLARNTLERFFKFLRGYGQGFESLPMWHTEAHHGSGIIRGGVFLPRTARVSPLWVEMFEQYGIPAERNPYWYDWGHGFWSEPVFMFNGYGGDKSPNPAVGLLSTLGREKFGKNFHHAIDFGSVAANAIFLGNVYGDPATGSVAVLVASSYLSDTSSVSLTVNGTTSAVTLVDAWGNESTVAQSSGRITVPVTDIPTFVRLPAGVTISVYSVLDWGNSPSPSVSGARLSASIGGSASAALADDGFATMWNGTLTTGLAVSPNTTFPDTAQILFPQSITVERVIVWTLPAQAATALLDFDVQTTTDGVTWTTQKTVTRTPVTFRSGSDSSNVGCQMESYDPVQWIDSITLAAPVSCTGVRLNVRAVTYGNMPDLDTANVTAAYGNATLTPQLCIQEIAVIASDTITAPSAYPTVIEADSPVGYWRLNETSGTTAASQINSPTLDGTYSGTYTLNNVALITGGSKGASDPTVTIAANAAHAVADTFSLEIWVDPIQTAAARTLVTKGSGFSLSTAPDGTLRFRLNSGAFTTLATTAVKLTAGVSHHVVVTKNGATTTIYVDGMDSTVAGTNVTFGSNSQSLVWGGNTGQAIGEAALYSTALTPTQVQNHYVAGIFPRSPAAGDLAPAITGSASTGSQVTVSKGTWTGTPNAYSYQWQSSTHGANTWANITGATRSDYILTVSETGKDVRCVVTASTLGGSETQNSNTIGAIA